MSDTIFIERDRMNRIVPLILAVALFMEHMDSTVISTALPAIAMDLGVSPITLKLALTSYMVSLAVFIPISGWMADKFGAKNIFRLAIGVFVIGSIMCAISSSVFSFVVSRFLQGMGGAMMTPIGRLVLLRTTDRKDLVSAMSLLTIPALVGPLTGPPIGGFITTYFTWHWIFIINVPIGIIGIWLSSVHLPEIPARGAPPLDKIGFVLTAVAAAGLVFGLSVVSLPALPPAVGIGTTLLGLLCGGLYILHSRRHPNPILKLEIFRNTAFRAATTSGSLFRIATGAVPFLMPLMLQLSFGMTPFQSGLTTFAGAAGALTVKFVAKRAFAAIGFRTALMSASVAGAAMTAVNALFDANTPPLIITFFLFASGLARSLFFTGANALSYSDIGDDEASQATSISSVMQQVSLALGVAFAALVLETSSYISGTHLQLADFHLAFLIVSAISLCSIIPILSLPRHAGASVSGHRIRTADQAEAPGE